MMPDFGTDLLHFIFNENNERNWEDVEDEIKDAVSKYVPNASIDSIGAVRDENDDNAVYIDVKYSVKRGLSSENNRMVIKL
jgi:phage baseplate assembly protein W